MCSEQTKQTEEDHGWHMKPKNNCWMNGIAFCPSTASFINALEAFKVVLKLVMFSFGIFHAPPHGLKMIQWNAYIIPPNRVRTK